MRLGWALLLAALAGCKPAAFAAHQGDLLRGPPPQLEVGQRASWNDVGANSFGMIELGAGAYRRDGQLCKVAEATSIGPAGSGTQSFLYCQSGEGAWRAVPGVTCRLAAPAAVSCRADDGGHLTMPRA